MESPTNPVLPGMLLKCSETDPDPDSLEIDYSSIAAMSEQDWDALSPVEYRFLEWVIFEEPEQTPKGCKVVFCIGRSSEDMRHIYDHPQSEICALLLKFLNIPLPVD